LGKRASSLAHHAAPQPDQDQQAGGEGQQDDARQGVRGREPLAKDGGRQRAEGQAKRSRDENQAQRAAEAT
jgi:hypothetical protein